MIHTQRVPSAFLITLVFLGPGQEKWSAQICSGEKNNRLHVTACTVGCEQVRSVSTGSGSTDYFCDAVKLFDFGPVSSFCPQCVRTRVDDGVQLSEIRPGSNRPHSRC